MAKKSSIEKNNKRKRVVAKYAAKRAALKAKIKAAELSMVLDLVMELDKLPKDASPTRVRNRCVSETCGRARGTFRFTGLCRCCWQTAYKLGHTPGARKASW
jgi:small subunit ribosomal protein S14